MVSPVTPPTALVKPAHLVVVVGESHHIKHFMPLLRRDLGHATLDMRLEKFLRCEHEALPDRVPQLDSILAQTGERDVRTLLCEDAPPCPIRIEALLGHLPPHRASVLVLETDPNRLEHELFPISSKARRRLEASIASFHKHAAPLTQRIEALKRRHPQAFSFIEHRRSIPAQVKHAHTRIAANSGYRMPACD